MPSSVLNKDNFLIWTGSFNSVAASNVATDDAATMAYNAANLVIDILLNDISTYGIDFSSIVITLQDNMAKPATWNSSTKRLTYYPPVGVAPGSLRVLKYTFLDIYGNSSNVGTINISVTNRITAWRGLASSFACIQAVGVNTGDANYATLEQYFTDDSTPTGTTKANDPADPDYIAPVADLLMCPITSSNTIGLVSADVPDGLCAEVDFTNYYIDPTRTITDVDQIFTDAALTTAAPAGYYSDGTYLLQLFAGGFVVMRSFCGF